jgi:hypothetical protein
MTRWDLAAVVLESIGILVATIPNLRYLYDDATPLQKVGDSEGRRIIDREAKVIHAGNVRRKTIFGLGLVLFGKLLIFLGWIFSP